MCWRSQVWQDAEGENSHGKEEGELVQVANPEELEDRRRK